LRRGDYVSLFVTENTLIFGRKTSSGSAIVALTRAGSAQSVTVPDVTTKVGIASGTVLHDHLGGPNVTVSNGSISLSIPAKGAVVLSQSP